MFNIQGENFLNSAFAETLKKLRIEKNLTQQQLANQLYVDRSTIANWETGRRIPDAVLIKKLAAVFKVDPGTLFIGPNKSDKKINILLIDDDDIIIKGTLGVLKKEIPKAEITTFSDPEKALRYAAENYISIVFLDIEMGNISGLDICRDLLAVNSRTNIIFLTAYPEYSLEAWKTGASGFLVKPIMPAELKKQLSLLRFPIGGIN